MHLKLFIASCFIQLPWLSNFYPYFWLFEDHLLSWSLLFLFRVYSQTNFLILSDILVIFFFPCMFHLSVPLYLNRVSLNSILLVWMLKKIINHIYLFFVYLLWLFLLFTCVHYVLLNKVIDMYWFKANSLVFFFYSSHLYFLVCSYFLCFILGAWSIFSAKFYRFCYFSFNCVYFVYVCLYVLNIILKITINIWYNNISIISPSHNRKNKY